MTDIYDILSSRVTGNPLIGFEVTSDFFLLKAESDAVGRFDPSSIAFTTFLSDIMDARLGNDIESPRR